MRLRHVEIRQAGRKGWPDRSLRAGRRALRRTAFLPQVWWDCNRNCAVALRRPLLFEHRYLALVVGGATAGAAGGADYGQDCQRLEGGAGDKDALRVRALVGRVDEIAFGQVLGEVGGHEAFEDFVVLEAEADPEAFGA